VPDAAAQRMQGNAGSTSVAADVAVAIAAPRGSVARLFGAECRHLTTHACTGTCRVAARGNRCPG
jgi:hypothetical protein